MRGSLYEISSSHKRAEKMIKDMWEMHAGGKPPNNKQRSHKKPYASRDKKPKAKEEGDIGTQSDEFDEIEALEFVKRALNIEKNLQGKGIKKLI
jgi:hypothetical protein